MRLAVAMTSVLFATSLLAIPAAAAPLGAALSKDLVVQAQSADQSPAIQIQYRRGGYRGGGRRGGGGGDGGAVAAGVLGGLLLGGIIANEAQRGNSVDYCMRRFRSYDPSSGTYLGNDGYRHRCP